MVVVGPGGADTVRFVKVPYWGDFVKLFVEDLATPLVYNNFMKRILVLLVFLIDSFLVLHFDIAHIILVLYRD